MRGEWAAVRAVAGFLLCLLLAGCVRGVHIVISGSVDAPVFSLSPSWILETDRTVCVRSFRVEELAASGDRGREVWSLSAQSRSCPKVRRLSYGTAPPGFDTHAAVAPLRLETRYRILLDGVGWLGVCEFEFTRANQAMTQSDQCRFRPSQDDQRKNALHPPRSSATWL